MSNATASECRSTAAPLPSVARAAYQGVRGAFGEDAVHRFFDGRVGGHPVATFDAVLDALASGDVEWAVLPVWNSTVGRVTAARGALEARANLVRRVGEVDVPVHHCLLALPGTALASVQYVGSHPVALSQCTGLFRLCPRLQAVEAFDTAGAARQLAAFDRRSTASGDHWYDDLAIATPASLAAIASAKAAATYGLEILQRGVNDQPTNFTRFVVLRAREESR